MKKILMALVIFILLFSISGFGKTGGKRFFLSAKSGFFLPTAERFGEVYKYGISFGAKLDLNIHKYAGLWMAGDYLMGTGEWTYTKDKVKFIMIPIKIGIRFFYPYGNFTPYIGGGGSYVMYKETSEVEGFKEHKENVAGFVIIGGVAIKIRSFIIDIGVEYSGLKIPIKGNEGEKIDSNGLTASIGIGIGF